MKRWRVLIFTLLLSFSALQGYSQCSVCTRTANQLGEKPARSLNAGILYLAITPLALIGFIGYRYYKKNKVQS